MKLLTKDATLFLMTISTICLALNFVNGKSKVNQDVLGPNQMEAVEFHKLS